MLLYYYFSEWSEFGSNNKEEERQREHMFAIATFASLGDAVCESSPQKLCLASHITWTVQAKILDYLQVLLRRIKRNYEDHAS
jgi:hypothetical protein